MLFPDAPAVFSVAQIAHFLKEMLADDDILRDVWIRGEISGYRVYPSSGHCYFTLKDADAQLSCVFFKQARLRSSAPDLRDGMAIVANGYISLYERDGKLQLYVQAVETVGDGALYLRFAELKANLEAEGLFESERKRPLPAFPRVIGIVTSPEAAALRDMLRVLRTRYPLVEVILSPSPVQGVEAPAALAGAIDLLNQHGKADVIIVGRGGGSIEDLWAFNEEEVARAIARSRIPVISGVGHETDFTIADFVADLRASTPTAAATAAVPNIVDLFQHVLQQRQEISGIARDYLDERAGDLQRTERELMRSHPRSLLDTRRQGLDDTVMLLHDRFMYSVELRRERLNGLQERLQSLSPLNTLARGYAIIRRQDDGMLVTSVRQVSEGDALAIQLTDGIVPVAVAGQPLQFSQEHSIHE